MLWKWIALLRGFREAIDEDENPSLLVVWHDARRIHYTGPQAWRHAALSTFRSKRAPI